MKLRKHTDLIDLTFKFKINDFKTTSPKKRLRLQKLLSIYISLLSLISSHILEQLCSRQGGVLVSTPIGEPVFLFGRQLVHLLLVERAFDEFVYFFISEIFLLLLELFS